MTLPEEGLGTDERAGELLAYHGQPEPELSDAWPSVLIRQETMEQIKARIQHRITFNSLIIGVVS